MGCLIGLTRVGLDTDLNHPSSNRDVGMSEWYFIIHLALFHLEVARPI